MGEWRGDVMQAKLTKIGWILMLILGIYRTVVAIVLIAVGIGDTSAGINLATTGAAIIGITLGSYRKAEKWSWWCLLVVGLVPFLAYELNPVLLVGWILFILGLAIPAKAILGKKSA